MNHTRFPKEDHLPDWARRDNKVTKGDRVENILLKIQKLMNTFTISKIDFNIRRDEFS